MGTPAFGPAFPMQHRAAPEMPAAAHPRQAPASVLVSPPQKTTALSGRMIHCRSAAWR